MSNSKATSSHQKGVGIGGIINSTGCMPWGLVNDTSALESEINRLVYQLYGLTEEEPTVAVPVGR